MTNAESSAKKSSKLIKYGGGFIALAVAIPAVVFVITEPWWKTLGAAIIIGGIWKAWKERPPSQPQQSFDMERYGVQSTTPKDAPEVAIATRHISTPLDGIFHWPDKGEFGYSITGTSHYQDALQKIAGTPTGQMARVHTVAHLVPEPNNPHDDKAIRVDISGKTVGYLEREDARSFRRRLGAKKIGPNVTSCGAEVWGGNVDRNGKQWGYGVKLDIKTFW